MQQKDWQKVKEVFALALEQPRERRAEFLRETCAGDPALCEEVESLLAAADAPDPLIERDNYGATAIFDARVAAYEGKQFGRYRVIRELGRGGMGAVFLAERTDGEFQQRVALKIVRRSFSDTDLARRFRRERQILASLNHPNIARLLDGGVSDDGEPFFVMEYVEGVRVDDYCDQQRLSTPERLRLFLSVCRGVSYAHQNLVVHRDIKPSNILVTNDGIPKLLDFGIAKLLDAENAEQADVQTQTTLHAFTPDYASPEQVRGERVTTAGDVYSLGVLLEELLLGAHSHKSATPSPDGWRSDAGEQKTVATNVPTNQEDADGKPKFSGRKSVSAELQNIISMARREEPARRYSSVAQFAEDIQRYLDGRPVRAQKDSFTYRAGKFVRRNKTGVGAALLVALSLVLGLAAALWQADAARRQRDRAERRFGDVRKLSNSLLFELSPKIERLPGATEAREILVARALEYLDSLARESGDDFQLQSELAAAYEKVGDLQGAPRKPNLNDFSGAVASYEKARNIRERLLARSPDDFEARKRLAATLCSLSYTRWWTSDITGSLADSGKALQLYERLLAEQPGSMELQLAAAEAELDLANIYYFNDQTAETYPPLRKALATLETLRQRDAENVETLKLLGRGYTLLGTTLFWDDKLKEGEVEMAKAFDITKALADRYPNDTGLKQGLLATYQQAAQIYQEADPPRAFKLLLEALRVAEESVASDAANTQARQNLAKTYSLLGLIAVHLKRLDEAILYLGKSSATFAELETIEPKNRTYKHDIARVLTFLGLAQHERRNYAEALASYDKAVALFEDDARADPKNIFPVRKLASVYTYIGDTHHAFAQSLTGQNRQAHMQAAKQNHQRALDIFLQLQAQNALTEKDHHYVEEVRAALLKDE